MDHKKSYIRTVLEDYPYRQFILIGDSGEHDPDIYAWAAETFGERIKEIVIRHVPNKEAGEQTMAGITALFGDNSAKVKFIDMNSGAILTSE